MSRDYLFIGIIGSYVLTFVAIIMWKIFPNKKLLMDIAILFSILSLIFVTKSAFPFLFENYKGWQKVTVTDYGTIKIPPDWKFEESDGYLQFYVENEKNNTKRYTLVRDGKLNEHLPNIVSKEYLESIYSFRSISVGKYQCRFIDGSTQEVIDLYMLVDNGATFFCIDSNVPEKTLHKIAMSFNPID